MITLIISKNVLRLHVFASVFVMATGVVVHSYENAPPHKFNFMNGECKTCHISYQSPFRFTKNITELCNECHGKDESVSHIANVAPSKQLGAEHPLDENRKMTCNTCHNIHMENLNSETGKRTYLLRAGSRGRAFCDSCHSDAPKAKMSGILVDAHMGYDVNRFGYEKIDKVSYRCLVCHSGSIANAVHFALETGRSIFENHPIGIEYKGHDLRDFKTLPPEIKIIEGKVGCVSCHDPYSVEGHKLTISNSSSKLCLTCHIK